MKQKRVAHWLALMVSFFLLAELAACGSSTSDKGKTSEVRAVHWGVSAQVGKKAVRLLSFVPDCVYNRPHPYVQRVRKVERPKRAIITMFVRFPVIKGGCADAGLGVKKTVKLRRPLSKISLFDGSTTPPRKRWPEG